jgi:hypothetical protein
MRAKDFFEPLLPIPGKMKPVTPPVYNPHEDLMLQKVGIQGKLLF